MNENQAKIIAESLVKASKVGTVNALTYVQKGFEAFKKIEIPVNENSIKIPYQTSGVREFVDFMIIYLDEAIKTMEDKKDKGE